MKTVLKIAKKALPSAAIYFCIFIGLMFAFTFFSGKEQEKAYQATQMDILLEDKDNTVLSDALTEYLKKENKVSEDFDKSLVPELIFNGVTDYVVYIEEGFEENFLAGKQGGVERQSIRANVAFLDEKVELFLRYVRAELALGKNMEEACEAVLLNCEKQAKAVVTSEKGQALLAPGYYFFTYLAYILPAVLIMILGPIMNAFYKKDVKMRTDCGKVSTRKQNIAVVGGIALIAMMFWGLLMLLGYVIYGKYFTAVEFLCGMFSSLLFLFVSIAISVLIGVLVRGDDALNGASNLVGMGMAFICGVFVPTEFLPDGVNKFGEFLPASWHVKNVELLFEEGEIADHMGKFLGNCGVIATFAVAIFCIFLVVVKRKKVA